MECKVNVLLNNCKQNITSLSLLVGTTLINLEDLSFDYLEVRDRDSERKEKAKQYADETRNTCFCDFNRGDTVLLKQEKETKLSAPFHLSPLKLVG